MKRMDRVRVMIRKLADVMAYRRPQNRKRCRAKDRHAAIRVRKAKRRILRDYQRRHHGALPDLALIPNGDYCYSFPCGDGVPYECRRMCPHHGLIEIPEAERDAHPGVVAEGQTAIGTCSLIAKTDDDFIRGGMLWDEVKMCPW
jgi:hypothetical protein